MKRLPFAIIALVVALDAQGVTIVGYSAVENDRFAPDSFPGTPVVNSSNSFIGHDYDLSGVGWNPLNPTQGFAMISDRYFIYASHYGPSSNLSFFSPVSGVVTFALDSTFTPFRGLSPSTGLATTDFMVGRLASSVASAGITSYPILDLGGTSAYIGLTALIYGHGGSATVSPRLGTNVIEGFTTYDIPANGIYNNPGIVYENQAGPDGEASFQGGDSGSPSFVAWHGQLALLGNHSAVATDIDTGVSYSLDNYAAEYLSQMAAESISFTSVPEPSRVLLLCGSFLAVILRRRR